jgi:hypothetical protein
MYPRRGLAAFCRAEKVLRRKACIAAMTGLEKGEVEGEQAEEERDWLGREEEVTRGEELQTLLAFRPRLLPPLITTVG